MESPCKPEALDISPQVVQILKRMRGWLAPLLKMPTGIPGDIISGPPLRAKCQIAWFNNLSGITSQLTRYVPDDLKTEKFEQRVQEADQLTYDLQIRVTDPETERRLTTLEDIKKGEMLIAYFVEKIDRILLPVRLKKYRDKMQSLVDDYIDEIPDELKSGPPLEYKCQWKWFQAVIAEIENLHTYLLSDEMKTDGFKARTEETMILIQSLHDREPDPDPKFRGGARTMPEDIEKANELLRFFIGEIDRILSEMQ